jgi:hypothetical protein
MAYDGMWTPLSLTSFRHANRRVLFTDQFGKLGKFRHSERNRLVEICTIIVSSFIVFHSASDRSEL